VPTDARRSTPAGERLRRIVIPGGSGQVGTLLARVFHAEGHDVVVLSRRPEARRWRTVEWTGSTLGPWQREIDGADVVVNLAGRRS
jgi:NAD dependent epimerase/dehydratase family enzyme